MQTENRGNRSKKKKKAPGGWLIQGPPWGWGGGECVGGKWKMNEHGRREGRGGSRGSPCMFFINREAFSGELVEESGGRYVKETGL